MTVEVTTALYDLYERNQIVSKIQSLKLNVPEILGKSQHKAGVQ